tara:strand:- start:3003 stop:4901 length:1899 start_codon:yes stop_codon:yes gene_type:complete
MNITKSIPRASAVLLACVLLAVVFNVATLMTEVLSDKSVPQAAQGNIDLTSIELSEVNSVPLSGNWEFYWQKLLTPSQIDNSKNESTHINVPHAWVRSTLDGQPLPTHGVATYRVNVLTNKKYANLSLKIPTIGTAYKLYIDDDLVSEGGKIGFTQETSEPGYNPEIILFEPKSDKFSITIQVSNHDFYWGGMWTTVRLGVNHNIHQEQYRQTLRSTFLLAIFLTVAIFNLIQFTLRTTDPLPILIALTCILLALREIESSQVLYFTGIAHWSFATNARVDFLSFYAASPLVIAYFHITFWQEYNKKLMAVIYALCTIASLFVVFTPPEIFSQTMPLFQGLIVLVMPYVFWGLIKAIKHKRYSARLLTMGTIFLFAIVLNDILYNRDIIDTTVMISFGLVTFILCQNYLTYTRFIDAGKQNRYLSKTLEERNEELQNFSQSLEENVKKRTDELAKANEKLGELAHKDMLTELPNRRGMMVFIEDAIINYRQNNTPFCLLVLDFDKFKKLNDTLGHEAGDKVLTEGATLMRQVLRDQDEVARWGGEEFLILLPSTPIKGAEIIANKLKDSLKETLTKSIGMPVSVTIGIAEFEKTDTLGSCFQRADKALYLGKNNGRDIVVLAEPAGQNDDNI